MWGLFSELKKSVESTVDSLKISTTSGNNPTQQGPNNVEGTSTATNRGSEAAAVSPTTNTTTDTINPRVRQFGVAVDSFTTSFAKVFDRVTEKTSDFLQKTFGDSQLEEKDVPRLF